MQILFNILHHVFQHMQMETVFFKIVIAVIKQKQEVPVV